jgi:hypothetical protein
MFKCHCVLISFKIESHHIIQMLYIYILFKYLCQIICDICIDVIFGYFW